MALSDFGRGVGTASAEASLSIAVARGEVLRKAGKLLACKYTFGVHREPNEERRDIKVILVNWA